MPQMISLRTFRLESTKGHIVRFEAKVPRFVPDAIVPEAMAAGCVPTDESEIPFYEDLSRAKVEFQGDIKRSMVYLAIKSLAQKNDSKDFDGGGYPKTKVVADLLGFEVERQMVIDLYQEYQQVTAEGREFALHPASTNILRVIEAGSKAELIELADEFGVPADKAKGLQVRDLRKMLLVKLDGVAVG